MRLFFPLFLLLAERICMREELLSLSTVKLLTFFTKRHIGSVYLNYLAPKESACKSMLLLDGYLSSIIQQQ